MISPPKLSVGRAAPFCCEIRHTLDVMGATPRSAPWKDQGGGGNC